ncbi:MAG: hypothetical protein ACP5MD_06745, partial [Verrucomicrobiia bacterium]
HDAAAIEHTAWDKLLVAEVLLCRAVPPWAAWAPTGRSKLGSVTEQFEAKSAEPSGNPRMLRRFSKKTVQTTIWRRTK